jgi:hypothetical protein
MYLQTFAIRWRDISDPVACPVIDGYYNDPYVLQRDLSGFVMMDGYELGGRVLHARSHAPAIFSRIATSPTSCVPLTFSSLPRSAGLFFFSKEKILYLTLNSIRYG